jgi:hypothetical protein
MVDDDDNDDDGVSDVVFPALQRVAAVSAAIIELMMHRFLVNYIVLVFFFHHFFLVYGRPLLTAQRPLKRFHRTLARARPRVLINLVRTCPPVSRRERDRKKKCTVTGKRTRTTCAIIASRRVGRFLLGPSR